MHNDGNVVPLRKAVTAKSDESPLARLPAIVLQVRDLVAQQLRQGLQQLFENADDTLFEMADRARNDVDQNIFFEAMRDLRLKRKSIERFFFEQLFEAFLRLTQDKLSKTPAALAVEVDGRSSDDLERTVAVEAMVVKVMNRDGYALDQLTARLSMLSGQKLIAERNPIGPAMICEYFVQAAQTLGVEIKVKLVILKLFERYVLSDADLLYSQVNQLLMNHGILPGLQPAPASRVSDLCAVSVRSGSVDANQAASMPLDSSVQAAFTALQTLLSHVRGSVAPTLEASAPAHPISTRDLLRMLSHLQQYVPEPSAQDDFDLRNQLEQLLTRVSVKTGTSRVVAGADEDVINLIAMLFDCILDDCNLPDSLKAQIARLQIPMLKVAVLDKSFFSRSSHPARRLLNEIAEAAKGWGESDDHARDSLYMRVDQVVQRLLNDFVDDPAIFAELLADFLAFTSDESRRSELLEQRTRDAEEGRAKTELARQRIRLAVNQALLGKVLPQRVVTFVQEAWGQVLLLTCLKHGDHSAEWHADVQTMQQLIWSVQRHDEPDAKLRLLALVPGLLKSLRDGLNASAFDPFATGEFFSDLETLHLQLFERADQPLTLVRAADAAMVEVREEVVLQSAEAGEALPRLPGDDASLLQVDQLTLGCWVEIEEDEEYKLRCKLTAIIEATGKHIFVNRTGLKVLERSRIELAHDFQRGAVRILADTLLFDRALESVIGNLRRLDRG